jgi:hypothetical protein
MFDPILSPEYLFALGAAILAVSAYAGWSSSELCGKALRTGLAGLRLLGVGGLILVAFNPGHWESVKQKRDTEWAILVDRSQSMACPDVNGHSRWDEAVRLARKALSLSKVPVRIHLFSNELESSVNPDQLGKTTPEGPSTDIAKAGKSLFGQTSRQMLEGVLIISDGGQNAPTPTDSLSIRALAAGSPIYSLPVGAAVARKDLSVSSGGGFPVGFVGQPVRLKASLKNEGLGNIRPKVELLDGTGKKLAEQVVSIADNSKAVVTFEVTPEKSGFSEYRIRAQSWPGEQIGGNNEARFDVNVLPGKIRVFLAEGVPYWDSKFLVQLLRNQPNLEVTSVYRLATERFFKLETDVSKASNANQATFPEDPAGLSAYDIIMFGKGVEYFLNPARIEQLRSFVRNQGGSIVFARGKPYSGIFADLEGIEPVEWTEALGSEFRLKPTLAGESAGLFGSLLAGRDDPQWQAMPGLLNASSVKLKAFSQVLAEGSFESGGQEVRFPAIVTRRYGQGLITTINADGLWTWDFFPSASEAGETYKSFWPQLLQWAATNSEFLPGQNYALRLNESQAGVGVPVRAHILRRNEAANDAPRLAVSQDGKRVQEVALTPIPDQKNEWEAIVALSEPGSYRVDVLAQPNDAAPAASGRLCVSAPPLDKDDLSANPELLSKLAIDSGGKRVEEADLEKILSPRVEAEPEPDKMNWRPMWDRASVLLVMLGLFGSEWFLRRRNGLI